MMTYVEKNDCEKCSKMCQGLNVTLKYLDTFRMFGICHVSGVAYIHIFRCSFVSLITRLNNSVDLLND